MLKFVYFQHTSVDIQVTLKMLHQPFLYHASVKEDEGKLRSIHIILKLYVVTFVYC